MIKKYGKRVDVRDLGRTMGGIKKMIEDIKISREKSLIPISGSFDFNCRICQSGRGYTDFYDIDGYKYVLCNNCGAIVLVNLPDVESLYGDDGIVIDHYIDKEKFHKRVKDISIPKAMFVLDAIKTQEKNICLTDDAEKVWCDIGCGVGELLMAIKLISRENNLNLNSIGIEADHREIAFGRELGLDICYGFLDPDNQNNHISELISNAHIVSMFGVLEHIPHPDKTIKWLSKCMKKDSILVIDVPRHPSLAAFANLTAPQYNYRHISPPPHLQIFTEESIDIILKDNFSIFAKWGFGNGYTDLLTNAMLMGNLEENDLYIELMNTSNEIQERVDEMGYSDFMIFVAKKQ